MEYFGDCFAHDSVADDCTKTAEKVVVLVTSSLSEGNYK